METFSCYHNSVEKLNKKDDKTLISDRILLVRADCVNNASADSFRPRSGKKNCLKVAAGMALCSLGAKKVACMSKLVDIRRIP